MGKIALKILMPFLTKKMGMFLIRAIIKSSKNKLDDRALEFIEAAIDGDDEKAAIALTALIDLYSKNK